MKRVGGWNAKSVAIAIPRRATPTAIAALPTIKPTTTFLRFPDAELSIIVLPNWDYADSDAEAAAFEIAGIYFD